mgnify:CR=1 FL=1
MHFFALPFVDGWADHMLWRECSPGDEQGVGEVCPGDGRRRGEWRGVGARLPHNLSPTRFGAAPFNVRLRCVVFVIHLGAPVDRRGQAQPRGEETPPNPHTHRSVPTSTHKTIFT